MNRKSLFDILCVTALFMGAVACGDKPTPDPGPGPTPPGPDPEPEVVDPKLETLSDTEINGTTLDATTNLAGLIKDSKTGKGIAGVAVSDGYSYTVTDANGVYQMKRNSKARKVYYTTPAQYEVYLDSKNHIPCFYSPSKMVASKKYRVDFTLTPLAAVETDFTLVAVGDPQCYNNDEVSRYKNETVADITSTLTSYKNVYAVTLGDITHDSTNLWAALRNSMANVEVGGKYMPFFQCIGNHDHNSLEADNGDRYDNDYRATQKYFDIFGPTDYSFDRGQAHIVVMDDIMVKTLSSSSKPNGKTWNYDGGFTDEQYSWFKDDLAQVKDKENKIVFLCLHIPFRGGSSSGGANINKDKHYADFLTAMTAFKEAHILIGHTHYPQNWIHTSYKTKNGQPIYEHVHQAACGSWWTCKSCVTGAPNGYNIYSISGASVQDWVNKGTDRDMNYQMRVYDGNQVYTGSKNMALSWYNEGQTVNGSSVLPVKCKAVTKGCFVAEIWDDDDTNWKVELYENGQKVGDFTRLANGTSANVAIVAYYFNEKGKTTDTWTNSTASHFWYCKPSGGVAPDKAANWEVRATQTIPTSGKTKTYKVNKLTTDYSEF
ncbi:MAG: calcineurin-like phosphoesterase C-terminal domain-containing protein [Bacteroidales bacterium]|nr:calcineurin-like phosphoesterase C-terminal domain-containing protein [Bacteroidales bacterium]